MADGFIEMHPGAEQIFAGLDSAGIVLRDGWRQARAAIMTGEAGIGDDEIAAAFLSMYRPKSNDVLGIADPLPDALRINASIGRASAADYRAADAQGAAVLSASTQGTLKDPLPRP